MRTLAWDRTARIAEIGTRIWAYLSPAARFEQEGLLTAAALLQWPAAYVARLGDLQFLLSKEVGAFLADISRLLRRLTTSSNRDEEWDFERLRGPVMWSRTLSLRAAGGAPNVWVTAPARRGYQTPENQMLVHLLDAIVSTGRSTGWDELVQRSEPADIVRQRTTAAEYWQQSRILQQIERAPMTPREVTRVRTGRARLRYDTMIKAYDRYESLVQNLDRQAVREAVEHAALVASAEGTLFELLCLFNVIDALAQAGWSMAPVRLFGGKLVVPGHRDDGRRLQLFYQSAPSSLSSSLYTKILLDHGISQQRLRPDMVLQWRDASGGRRWLLVECKLSESHGAGYAARQALVDLLAYRQAFDPVLSTTKRPYGLGLAWGEGLSAYERSDVLLATPDRIPQAVAAVVH